MLIVLVEDDRVTQLYPITVSRPACAISCGSFRLVDLAAELGHPLHLLVRPHLVDVWRADGWNVGLPGGVADEPVLMLNARLVPSAATFLQLQAMLAAGRPALARQATTNGANSNQAKQVAAALIPAGSLLATGPGTPQQWTQFLTGLDLPAWDLELPLFDYPHDIVRHHLTTLGPNLDHRLAHGEYSEIADGVFAAQGARIGQYIVSDTSKGPIVLEAGASIGPYCYLSGPAHLGAGARVIEQAAIKDCVALGHTTKIGGEVEGSIIEPYTNKQHHGFLGHSYLGSWVNLGAGTCNSDLKNTYGHVNMEYQGQKVATGMQFIGCLVGDYAKSAINTGIFTGKTIGACSMLYGFVTTNVPSFVNYARSFGQVTEAPVEVMVATQLRMFARRNVQQRPCDVQLLYDMHELTRHERQIAGEPLSL